MYTPLLLIMGVAVGVGCAWFFVQKAATAEIRKIKAEDQVELARLNERFASQTSQTEALRSELHHASDEAERFRAQLEALRVDYARFQEQATRIGPLEEELRCASERKEQLGSQTTELREKLAGAESIISTRGEQLTNLGEEILTLNQRREELLNQAAELQVDVAKQKALIESERKQNSEKLATLSEAEGRLRETFKSLANEILEEKSERFTELNRTQVIEPFRTSLEDFRTRLENVHNEYSEGRATLSEQLSQLRGLNQRLSEDANNLARALKGDTSNRPIGDWGEMIMERILESSGLRKDEGYKIKPTFIRPNGSRAVPDAVIFLPEGRNLIIDSKASLGDYDEYVRAESDDVRSTALQRHVAAMRRHLEDLTTRNYQGLPDLNSPDFVVMFVPIEPAFILAVAGDHKLWEDGWKNNVLLVSPTSFLFVVRIVANLWNQDAQRRNYHQIVDRGAALYDKLVGFVDEFLKIGERLQAATESFDLAHRRLTTGSGNVIRQAEMLKDLGVKPSKDLPLPLIETAAMDLPALSEVGDGTEQN